MRIHTWLMKNVGWYNSWHKKPYAGFVHVVVVLVFFAGNLYLLIEIFKYASIL